MVGTKKLDWFPNTIYFTANKGKYNKMKTTNRIIIFFAPYAGTRFLSTSITIWLCLFSTFTLSLSYLWWISSRNCFTSDFFADFIEKIIFPSIVSKIKWELSDVSETTVLLISVNASPKGKEEKFFAIWLQSETILEKEFLLPRHVRMTDLLFLKNTNSQIYLKKTLHGTISS